MVVAAVAIAAVSWGAAAEASYSLLSVAAAVGATAGAILAVAGFIGIDLGVLGDVLQVVAIVAAVYTLGTSAYTYVNQLEQAADTVASTASTASGMCTVASNNALAIGSTTSASFTEVGNTLTEISSNAAIASSGALATETSFTTLDDLLAGSTSFDSVKNAIAIADTMPAVEPTAFDMLMEGVGFAKKALSIYNSADGLLHPSKLISMKNDLMAMRNEAEKQQASLDALLKAKTGAALQMMPVQIETGPDRMTSIPDPMAQYEDLHASLMSSSVGASTQDLIWTS